MCSVVKNKAAEVVLGQSIGYSDVEKLYTLAIAGGGGARGEKKR